MSNKNELMNIIKECCNYNELKWRHKLIIQLVLLRDKIFSNSKSLLFNNGSVVVAPKTNSSTRGRRAKILDTWSDHYGCFVRYDGNKPKGKRHSYFILNDGEIEWVDIVEE